MRVAIALAATLALAGCGNKKGDSAQASAPPTIELAAVPASAEVVIGADVRKLAQSRLVELAVQQMYRRDPGLETRIDALRTDCGIDPGRDIERLVIGMGPAPDQVVLIAAGGFEDSAVATCLNKIAAAGGGSVNAQSVDGRVIYKVDNGETVVWLAVGAGGVLAVSPSEAFLRDALGGGGKVWNAPAMTSFLTRVDRSRTLWAAGLIPGRTGAGLVEVTSGAVKAPPVAVFGTLELDSGMSAELGLVMASADDATTASSRAVIELALGASVAQRYGLGRLVSKVKASAEGEILMISADLTMQDLNDLLAGATGAKGLDTKRAPLQDSAVPNPETDGP